MLTKKGKVSDEHQRSQDKTIAAWSQLSDTSEEIQGENIRQSEHDSYCLEHIMQQ